MKDNFELLNKMIVDLNESNSNNEKQQKLKNYDDDFIKTVLKYVYDDLKKFNITSDNLKKYGNSEHHTKYDNIFLLLEDLNQRNITGNNALAITNGFINENREYADIIYKIIDKNLEIRMDKKSINKVFKNLIPEFSVSLAVNYTKQKKKIDFINDDWYSSRKLDGVRCICIVQNGEIEFRSRKGIKFNTLDNLIPDIQKIIEQQDIKSFVLDGEICLVDENGNENFQDVMKEIRRKNHNIKNPVYNVFDIISLNGFKNKKDEATFSKRQKYLDKIINDLTRIKKVKQIKIKNDLHFKQLIKEANECKWEGLIIRKDCSYEGKRTNKMLKYKEFKDFEAVVVDTSNEKIRVIEDGREKTIVALSHITINYKDNTVDVGSGFSLDQRKYYCKYPEEIIGKEITVQYFEETTDQNGKKSLRFPVVKVIHGNKREV